MRANPRKISQLEVGQATRAKNRTLVLEAAIGLAAQEGYQWITRDGVARAAGVGVGTVNNCFRSMLELKREVLRQAVARRLLQIVAEGLANGSPIARDAPPDLKAAAAAAIRV